MQLAVKSCLQCLASYCRAHLGPHNDSPALKKHQLTESTTHLQDLVCAVHREPLKVYCRTDQRCVCLLCTMDQHKHHDTVSAVAECAERQKSAQTNFQKWIQEREKKLLDTKQEEHLLTHAARTAVEESERLFADIIHSIEGQRSRVKELILCEERKALVPVKSLQERLEQEITQLRGRDAELQKLAQMEDPISFLQRWRFLSTDPGPCIVPGVTAVPNLSFQFVSKAVSELRDQLETVCQDKFDKLSEKVSRVNKVSAPPSRKHRTRAESPSTSTSRTELRKLRSGETGNGCGPRATKVQILESPESLPEPRTREEFLKYACELTLDPNTAHAQLLLSDRDREKSAQTNFQKWIQEREKKLLDTRQEEHLLTHTARTAVEESERLFADIIHSIEGQRSRVKELILCEERKALVPVKSLQERLEQEITQLRGSDAELQKLAQMEDPICFLQRWRVLSTDPGPCIVPGVTADPNLSFQFVSKAVSELRDRLETVCQDKFDKLSEKVSRVNEVSAPPSRKHRTRAESPSTSTSGTELRQLRSGATGNGCGPRATKVQILASPKSLPEPRTREEFLKYACELTLDPNTAHAQLLLSDRNREAKWVKEKQRYPNGPERFDKCQVLCSEALSGRRCYWEVEVRGNKAEIAVTYEGIKKKAEVYRV
ncbi:hypothetical protein ANANG_G00244940 [Anguilla anguilla]|uniref:B box-type domain-containing protein n=1 Tax=Anguilla anguilla TaxID=7936 RepID=A0A9D3LTT1_ANGAN|nr:hypothetical protein ANANG_G00244940 [Anguilla anguilla]